MFTLNCRGQLLVIREPLVMGIINLTEDSFYAGSRFNEENAIVAKAEQMIREGASILDLGGQSTRPGSELLSEEEETTRIVPAIKAIRARFPEVIISVDTFYAGVASEAVAAGAGMVNDVSAGSMDTRMLSTIAALQVPYVLMHMKGVPKTMQENPRYEDVCLEVLDFLSMHVSRLRNAGVKDVIVDPGFGFGKTIAHNFELLRRLSIFRMLDCPLLLGISRKSTIYRTLGVGPGDALNGSTVLHTIGLLNGADILRVHDVREAREAIRLVGAYKGQ